jgi:putative ABC transport system substrate-binding protein
MPALFAARAQQAERVRRIALLTGIAGEDAQTKIRIAAFLLELQKLGWTEGRNVRIDIRAGAGNLATTRKYAAELVALAPDNRATTIAAEHQHHSHLAFP